MKKMNRLTQPAKRHGECYECLEPIYPGDPVAVDILSGGPVMICELCVNEGL